MLVILSDQRGIGGAFEEYSGIASGDCMASSRSRQSLKRKPAERVGDRQKLLIPTSESRTIRRTEFTVHHSK